MAFVPGTPNDDPLDGTEDADTISGYGGADTINAFGAADEINGGTGNDEIYGGDGLDTIYGGSGDDTIWGGSGNDLIYGGVGVDLITIGDIISGGGGLVYGGDGDDEFSIFGQSDARIYGGTGTDTLRLGWSEGDIHGAVRINISTGAGRAVALNGTVQFSGIEKVDVSTGNFNDTITGGALGDQIGVSGGSNRVQAGAGDDIVSYLIGGKNSLDGGADDDLLIAGQESGSMYFIVDTGTGSVDDGQLSSITGFERYRVTAGNLDDIVSTGDGNDSITLAYGNDTAFGSGGNDRVHGGHGDDELYGGSGRDTMIGGIGADIIDGGEGDDRLNGVRGNDTLTGGAGADVFVFNQNDNGLDLITDFASGEDRLFLGSIYLGGFAPPPGAIDPSQISNGGPVGSNAQFVTSYRTDIDKTWLLWFDRGVDTNGSFLLLTFEGNVALAADDFLMI